jgi:hypothetical protein
MCRRLMIDIMDTLDQREAQYGDYRDVAKISQLIKMAREMVIPGACHTPSAKALT